MVRDDTKCALFIFVTLGTKYRSKKDEREGSLGMEAKGAVSTRREIYIFTRNVGRAFLRGATIEIGVASGRNKNSLPSVSPVFPRTRRFFSVSRQKHNRQNWDTQVRIRKYTGPSPPPRFPYCTNNNSCARRKCIWEVRRDNYAKEISSTMQTFVREIFVQPDKPRRATRHGDDGKRNYGISENWIPRYYRSSRLQVTSL